MTNKSILIEYHRNHLKNSVSETNRNGRYLSNLDRATEKSKKKLKATEADSSATKEKRSRILLKIPRENESEENQQEEPHKIDNNLDEDGEDNDEAEEEGKMNNNDDEPKTWNLRPRKQICKSLNGVPEKINGSAMLDKKAQSPLRNSSNRLGENEANGGAGQKKEKRKLSVSIGLSKEEIEEDVFILTGSKPTRRPKKRAKNIQKHLDYLFPGLWLTSITPDSYKVSETYLKG
ncbi:Protein of unknown function (DUF1639) [Abeliophyllum distichum]|uniref:Uncharacterized protein n=1 Tax=Abeliophyllum distichum TaxID=126358 RepID=A0ABD1PAF3_9LAMI